MEKFKNFFKVSVTNKAMWIALVTGILIIIGTTATVCTISYMKARETLANTNIEEPENIIKQEELIDTSKLSEEELKKINEEEQKKLEEKKKEEEKKKGNTTTSKPVNYPYYIKVNYGAQVVTIYGKDKNGKYTVPVKAMVCSTGYYTPTSGVYRLGGKWNWGQLIGPVWGQYCSVVVGDILFHSVPYKVNGDKGSLISKYYDKLGSKDSLGCIRLTTIDAKWLFYNCPSGTQVEFYSSSNPGPLGKPTARKVSNMPGDLKNWDPTDPDPKNPWIAYLKKEQEENNKPTNTEKPTDNNTIGNNATNPENTTGNNTTNSENTTGNNTTTNTENPGENTNTETNTPSTNPTVPTTPTNPETPDKPAEPKPEDSTTPTKPESDKTETPTTPTEPEKPTNPTTPTETTTPTESDKPSDQEAQSGSEKPTETEKTTDLTTPNKTETITDSEK